MTRAGEKGFTLVEILVAMAVLAVVLGTLFRVQSSTISLALAVRFHEVAHTLACKQMEALAREGYNPEEPGGEFEGLYAGYSWFWEVETGAESSIWCGMISHERAEDLKRIRLTIISPEKDRSFHMEAWRYVPPR